MKQDFRHARTSSQPEPETPDSDLFIAFTLGSTAASVAVLGWVNE